MPKLSISGLTLNYLPFKAGVDEIARAGVAAIGVSKQVLGDTNIDQAARIVRDAGLHTASYMAGGRFLQPGGLTQSVKDTRRCIDEAARLGADMLYLVSGPEAGYTWEDADKRFLDGLHQVLPMARSYGIPLVFEPVHPILGHICHVHRLVDAVELLDGIEEVRIVVDTWHLGWDRALERDLVRYAGRIAQVQVSDHDAGAIIERRFLARALPGKGVLPLRRILRTIEDSGFQGYYDLEIIRPVPEAERPTYVQDCKRAFESMWE